MALAALPAAFFGVWLGLKLRSPIAASGIVGLVTVFVNSVYLMTLIFRNDVSYLCRGTCYVFHPYPDPFYWFGAAVVVLVALTLGFFWAARRAA